MKMEEFKIECDFGDMSQAYRDGKKFYVEYDDFIHYVMGSSFCLNSEGYVKYSSNKDGLRHKYLHRVIMGCPDDMVVDHIDHNPFNNMRSNLRIATQHQNNMNKNKRADNTSGITGVYWRGNKNKWQVYIQNNKKTKSMGYFTNFEDACKARKEAEIKYYGEFRNKDNE